MSYHRRNLPHFYPPNANLFVTWRLFGSTPRHTEGFASPDAGKTFLLNDRDLDRAAQGPLWLKEPRIAQIVAQAFERGMNEFRLYELIGLGNYAESCSRCLRTAS
jgi:putative transposase